VTLVVISCFAPGTRNGHNLLGSKRQLGLKRLVTILTFSRLRSTMDPVMGRVRVLAVLAQIRTVPKRRPTKEFHVRNARNVSHDAAR